MTISSYIQLYRSPETLELLDKKPKAFLLLTQIALRAKRTNCFNVQRLEIGEALIGDHEKIGLTQREYRTAKNQLKKYGFATFKTTNKGTIAKLTNSSIFNINEEETTNEKPNKRQSGDNQKTTNNNDKNDKNFLNNKGGKNNNEQKRGSIMQFANN